MSDSGQGKRGRPVGHKLSEESKRAIAESKRGQKHKPETKEKISRSLIIYFNQFNSISDELINRYCRTDDDELCDWVNDVREDLDSSEDVLTHKRMMNKRKIEICCGPNIEFFSHNLTPEFMVILKDLTEKCPDDEDIIENL